MSVKTVVSLADQLAVEPLFADTRLITRHEEDSLALCIEGKRPLSVSRAEPQLLHIRVARTLQRINAGPPQSRPELLENAGQRQNFRPRVFLQHEELRLEFVADLDSPAHP